METTPRSSKFPVAPNVFDALNSIELRELSALLAAGTLTTPFTRLALERKGFRDSSTFRDLQTIEMAGLSTAQLGCVISILADERSKKDLAVTLELVGTSPAQALLRDTSVVVEQLFGEAKRSVIVSGFKVFDGAQIFRTLAGRLDADPKFDVVLYLDIGRSKGDNSIETDILGRFASNFRNRVWPGKRLPQVFYDPRSLEVNSEARAVLHAKTVVIDNIKALVTSANPTPNAYYRNIELGVTLQGGSIPLRIAVFFDALAKEGTLKLLSLT